MADSVSSVDTNSSLYNSGVQRKANGQLDKNAFLYILTTELSNQDPMNTKDNTEYIAQLAQFSSLEQMQNLNASISKLLTTDKIMNGAALIGKNVQFKVGDNDPVVEKIKSVKSADGDIVLVSVNGKSYTFDQISQIDAEDNLIELQDNVNAGGVQNDNQSSK